MPKALPECSFCGKVVERERHEWFARACGHTVHVACYAKCVQLSRGACRCETSEARLPTTVADAMPVGGYAMDPGRDAALRGRLIHMLEHNIEAGTCRALALP